MLSQSQKSVLERARALGTGSQGIALDDAQCAGILTYVIRDLGLASEFPGLRLPAGEFFDVEPEEIRSEGVDLLEVFERILVRDHDADTYFACLAALHKSRLKYAKILALQPIPTIDQVGPRALLQFGRMQPADLAALLYWRKWMFDLDNRAGQETGYLFEPIIASAVGGTPAGARRSPVKRQNNPALGRQVDCIKGKLAYEIKIRVTIAASGQGRWQEELDFATDARSSGFVPILVVLDPTSNPKLTELTKAFEAADGQVHIGDDAWAHLEAEAGPTMSRFLERYVRQPLDTLVKATPLTLPELSLQMTAAAVVFRLGATDYVVKRSHSTAVALEELGAPSDTET